MTQTPLPEQIAESMRRHEHEAPDGAGIARRVEARLGEDDGGGSRSSGLTVAAVAAAAVVAVVLTAVAVTRGGQPLDVTPAPLTPPASTSAPSPSRPAAVLDPLSYRLVLRPRRPDGSLPSRMSVANRSQGRITDPGCRLGANFSFGVVPVDRPNARLSGRVITDCAGPQELPVGFEETFSGPTFSVRGLPPGDYLAVIDFGDARSERLSAPLSVRAQK